MTQHRLQRRHALHIRHGRPTRHNNPIVASLFAVYHAQRLLSPAVLLTARRSGLAAACCSGAHAHTA
jgi:hypothetical protein